MASTSGDDDVEVGSPRPKRRRTASTVLMAIASDPSLEDKRDTNVSGQGGEGQMIGVARLRWEVHAHSDLAVCPLNDVVAQNYRRGFAFYLDYFVHEARALAHPCRIAKPWPLALYGLFLGQTIRGVYIVYLRWLAMVFFSGDEHAAHIFQ